MRGKSLAVALLLLSCFALSLAAEDATTADLGATAAGDGAAVVGNAIDTNTNPTKEAAESTETAKSGEELTEAVEANSEAQDYNEKTKPVKAQVVKQEPAAMLASGTGDLDTTGNVPFFQRSGILFLRFSKRGELKLAYWVFTYLLLVPLLWLSTLRPGAMLPSY